MAPPPHPPHPPTPPPPTPHPPPPPTPPTTPPPPPPPPPHPHPHTTPPPPPPHHHHLPPPPPPPKIQYRKVIKIVLIISYSKYMHFDNLKYIYTVPTPRPNTCTPNTPSPPTPNPFFQRGRGHNAFLCSVTTISRYSLNSQMSLTLLWHTTLFDIDQSSPQFYRKMSNILCFKNEMIKI